MTQAAVTDTPADAPPEPVQPRGSGPDTVEERPSRLRLLAEALGLTVLTALLSAWAVPALRDRGQTIFYDVIVNATTPDRHGFAGWLADGVWLPTWLRTSYGGEPYFANTQHGVAYPGNLPFWLMSTSVALEVVTVLHLIIAALGTWAYCRICLRTSMWAGYLGAIAFAFGGSMLAHITLGDQLEVISLMPLLFFTGHMALERRKLRWVVACAVAIGLPFLAGHVEEWLYFMVALAGYGAVWIVARERTGQLRRLRQAVVTLGGACVLFVLLFSWQLLPTYLLSGQSYRNSPDYRQQYPLPKQWGLNALLPDWGRITVGENVAFIGIVGLCLVGFAVVSRRRDLLWVRAWVLLTVLFGLILAVGNQNSFYAYFYERVSSLREFRVPVRWLLPGTFALAVGAAIGLDELLTGFVGRWRARVLHAGAAVAALGAGLVVGLLVADIAVPNDGTWKRWILAAVGGALAWALAGVPRVPRLVPALLLLTIVSVELATARPYAEFRQKVPGVAYDQYGGNLEALGADGGRFVTIAGQAKTEEQRNAIPLPPEVPADRKQQDYYRAAAFTRVVARPSNHLAEHAESILGRDGGFLPFKWYREFYYAAADRHQSTDLSSGVTGTPPSQWDWTALDLMAVEWFVTSDDLPEPERVVLRAHGFRIDGSYAYALRWRRDGTSLARLVHAVDVVPGEADRIARLQADYPLLERGMVEEPVSIEPGSGAADEVATTAIGHASVDLRVTTASRSLLVLADPWYPGWQVTIDGKKADLLRTDHAFRGVVVPAGTHDVRFRYVDRRMQAGTGLTGLTVLGLLVLPPVLRRRRRRRTEPTAPGAPGPDVPAPRVADVDDSGEPAGARTPADDPAESADDPAESADDSAKPADDSAKPADDPVKLAGDPPEPADRDAVPKPRDGEP